MVIDLRHTSGAGVAPVALDRLELLCRLLRSFNAFLRLRYFADPTVDVCRRFLLHGIGDVGVDVQCRCRRGVTDDSGQGFYIHTVFQCSGSEGMP